MGTNNYLEKSPQTQRCPRPMATNAPESKPAAPQRKRSSLACILALLGLLFFHLCVNLWWLDQDNHVIRTDEEGHMHLARQHYRAIAIDNPGQPFKKLIALADIIGESPIHPPLLHVAGAIMIRIFGYSTDVIAGTGTILFLLALLGCFRIARLFLGPWSALYAVFVVSFTPMVYVLSRAFSTDFLSMTIVIWALYALLKSNYFRDPGWVFVFAVLNGLGILSRTPTFLYYIIPCFFIIFLGACTVFANRQGRLLNWGAARLLLLNCALTLVVTIGIFSPWYFRHLETIEPYWNRHYGGQAIAIMDNLAAPAPAPQSTAAQTAPGIPASLPAEAPAPAASFLDSPFAQKFINPQAKWRTYPFYVVNQGMFLPLFLISLLGIPLAFLFKRYRSLTTLLLLIAILSSWALMTVLFKFVTARYALQMVPALAFFAAIAVLAPPWKIPRVIACSLLAAFLLFQFGNLTARAYGDYARAGIEWSAAPYLNERDNEPVGTVIYKDAITLSNAYSALGPPSKGNYVNYKDEVFNAMVAHEKNLGAVAGEYADYVRMNMRGMDFDQEHYWPGSPFLREDIGPPGRKLRSIGLSQEGPEILENLLGRADYVVYFAPQKEPGAEQQYLDYFAQRGFVPIKRFAAGGFGQVEARFYGVLAHKDAGTAVEINENAIRGLDLNELYQVTRSALFRSPTPRNQLGPALRQLTLERLQAELTKLRPQAYQASPYKMSEEISLMGITGGLEQDGSLDYHLYFRADRPLTANYRIYFRAYPESGKENQLPEPHRSRGYVGFDFDPDPQTLDWEPGEYYRFIQNFNPPPGVYRIEFGFMSQSGIPHGESFTLGFKQFPADGQRPQ